MPDERRNAARLLRDENVVVKILAAPTRPELVGTEIECSTVDVSATGLRLLLETPVAEGSELGLEVDVMERGERYNLGGKVMWSRQTEADGIYLIGVQLLHGGGFETERWDALFL
jgi:hypothetical protein